MWAIETSRLLSQLFFSYFRESARKVVHLLNFTGGHAAKIPKKIRSSAQEFLHHILHLTDRLLRVRLESYSTVVFNQKHFSQMMHIDRAQAVVSKISETYDEVQSRTSSALVRIRSSVDFE